MKKKSGLITAVILLICVMTSAQNFREVQPVPFSETYLSMCNRFEGEMRDDPDLILQELEKKMPEVRSPFERFQLYLWYYAPALDELGRHTDLLEMLDTAHGEGLGFLIMTGERSWPHWVPQMEKITGFSEFLRRNEALISKQAQQSTAEYFVRLPEGYSEDQQYPLFIMIHGGVGYHQLSAQHWKGGSTHDQFITAYLQGENVAGTFQRRFNDDNMGNIHAMIADIKKKYAVDESRIVIGGPSRGGYRTLLLGWDDSVKVSGLLMAFPVIPGEITEENYLALARKNLKVALITGEHDGAIVRQKALCVNLDKIGVPNRLLIFPEKGHEYPDEFSRHLDTSLEFLLKKRGEDLIE
ncbi:MAG: hypothetical protein ACLFPE_10015 [Bacteroidales bacterium]